MSRAFFADNSVALSPKSMQAPCLAPVIACRNAPPCPAIRRVTALTMLFIFLIQARGPKRQSIVVRYRENHGSGNAEEAHETFTCNAKDIRGRSRQAVHPVSRSF